VTADIEPILRIALVYQGRVSARSEAKATSRRAVEARDTKDLAFPTWDYERRFGVKKWGM